MKNRFAVSEATQASCDSQKETERMNWFAAIALGCGLSLLFLYYFTAVVDAVTIPAMKGAVALLRNAYPEVAKPVSRGLSQVVFFLGSAGLTFLYLLPVNFLVQSRPKAIVIAAISVAPVTLVTLVTLRGAADLNGWLQAMQTISGLVAFTLLASRSTSAVRKK